MKSLKLTLVSVFVSGVVAASGAFAKDGGEGAERLQKANAERVQQLKKDRELGKPTFGDMFKSSKESRHD